MDTDDKNHRWNCDPGDLFRLSLSSRAPKLECFKELNFSLGQTWQDANIEVHDVIMVLGFESATDKFQSQIAKFLLLREQTIFYMPAIWLDMYMNKCQDDETGDDA